MATLTITNLADLRVGDRPISFEGRRYNRPLTVSAELAPIEPGSPVYGVRLDAPGTDIEWVLYPAQIDGHELTIERPEREE